MCFVLVGHADTAVLPARLGLICSPHCSVILEDRTICGGDVFYKPGSQLTSTNRVPPSFRILVREDVLQGALDVSDELLDEIMI